MVELTLNTFSLYDFPEQTRQDLPDTLLTGRENKRKTEAETLSRWYETSIFYHIYPLGLCGAPRNNEHTETVHRLPKLLEWLEHLKELHVGGIYIGPLFESSSHGYDTIDYRRVDSRLGDNDDFRDFVNRAHELGMRVVVDGVFNHTGREFFAFEDIRRNRENSPYRWWYKGINFDWNSAYNDGFSYESWRNCGNLINLNLQNREVKDYLFDVIRFWVSEFDIDGIRLDCADVLDFDFMKEMRWMSGSLKEDFWLLGEVIHGDYARWANDSMLHSVTNYELHKGLYSGHNDHNYFEIAHTIRRQFDANGGIYRGRTLYTFADNHDVARLPDKLRDQNHLRPVYTLVYTLPGLPSVYYGSEWGIRGRKEDGDEALRPCIDLRQISQEPPVPGLNEYLCLLGKIREENAALREGQYRELLLTNRQYAFARILGNEAVITAVNNDDREADVWIPLPMAADTLTDLTDGTHVPAEGGKLHIQIPAGGSRLLRL